MLVRIIQPESLYVKSLPAGKAYSVGRAAGSRLHFVHCPGDTAENAPCTKAVPRTSPKPRLRANGKQKGAGIFHYEFGLVGKMRENRLLTDSRFERSIL